MFRIARKEQNSNWFRCHLDDYVNYNNGDYKHIDFENQDLLHGTNFAMGILGMPTEDIPRLGEGDYIRVDMNMTREHSSNNNFGCQSITKVGYERVDSEGNVSIFSLVGDVTQEVLGARERYAEMARERQLQNQIILRQTSWNMPPR